MKIVEIDGKKVKLQLVSVSAISYTFLLLTSEISGIQQDQSGFENLRHHIIEELLLVYSCTVSVTGAPSTVSVITWTVSGEATLIVK
jgi:hypothetical protein